MKRPLFSLIASISCLVSFPVNGFTAIKAIKCYRPDIPEEVKQKLEADKLEHVSDKTSFPLLIFDDSTEEIFIGGWWNGTILKKLSSFDYWEEDGSYMIGNNSLMISGNQLVYVDTFSEKSKDIFGESEEDIVTVSFSTHLINLDTMKAKKTERFLMGGDLYANDNNIDVQCFYLPSLKKYSIER